MIRRKFFAALAKAQNARTLRHAQGDNKRLRVTTDDSVAAQDDKGNCLA